MFTIVFFWLGFSVAVAMFASIRRNRSGFGWFLLSLLISPLLSVIFLLIVPVKVSEPLIINPNGIAARTSSVSDTWAMIALGGTAAFAVVLMLGMMFVH